MPLKTKTVAVGTAAIKVLDKGDTFIGATVYFQTDAAASCFVGDSTVTSTGSTKGLLIPTSAAGGDIPSSLKVGGYDLWAIVGTGTTNLTILYIAPPFA